MAAVIAQQWAIKVQVIENDVVFEQRPRSVAHNSAEKNIKRENSTQKT